MMKARHALLVAVAVAGVLVIAAHCAASNPECNVAAPATCGDDDCVDLLNDPHNCGVCAFSCNDGTCARGLCQCGGTSCTFGSVCCGAACADLDSDPLHCGSCENACPAALACLEGVCASGGCDPGCSTGLTCCGRGCVDTRTSLTNCGRCGNACPSGQICESGTCIISACTPACVAPERCCGEACTNVDSDTDNCGSCGTRCLDDDPLLADSCVKPTSGTAHCSCHGSPRECVSPSICCPDGCRNLTMDPANCGACGTACGAGETCSAGNCVCGTTGGHCPAGELCCDGACIDTTDDMAHCGSCTTVCNAELADACVDGACKCGSSAACTRPVMMCVGMVPYQKCCTGTCVTLGVDTDCADCGAPCDSAAGQYCNLVGMGFPPCSFACS